MATRPNRVILTYDDYAQIPNDRNRYELFEGELVVTPSPSWAHQTVVTNLAWAVSDYVRRNNLGKVAVAPMDVLLSNITVVQPDLLFVARERLSIIQPRYVQGPPDLVVEVISPSTVANDRQVKQQLYARYAVPHFWLFDPEERRADAYQLTEGNYQLAATAEGSERFAAPPYPDLSFPLDDLWE